MTCDDSDALMRDVVARVECVASESHPQCRGSTLSPFGECDDTGISLWRYIQPLELMCSWITEVRQWSGYSGHITWIMTIAMRVDE